MAVQIPDLYLLQDLEDPSRTTTLDDTDLRALRSVADWIQSFVVRPHKDLGRDGPVCPYVPRSLEGETLWLAAERIANRSAPEMVELVSGYQRLLLDAQPTEGDDAGYRLIVIVFPDLPAERAQGVFDEVLKELAAPSYVDHRILFGPFYEGNEGTAIYNPRFRPFQSPVPFLFVRFGVIGDWKFFVDNDESMNRWARQYGESAVPVLAAELRRTNWRRLEA